MPLTVLCLKMSCLKINGRKIVSICTNTLLKSDADIVHGSFQHLFGNCSNFSSNRNFLLVNGYKTSSVHSVFKVTPQHRLSMIALRQLFGNRVISRFDDIHWLPRLPDLTVCDLFYFVRSP